MKANVYGLDGKSKGQIELPAVFKTVYRPDLIKRAVIASQTSKRQAYGADILAGKRTSAHYHGKRHYRFSMMNKEMARISRIHGKSASGSYLNLRARLVPQAVKGRRAHPPKAEKIWAQEINKKELLLSMKSAIAATANLELVKEKYVHVKEVPIIIDDSSAAGKTKELASLIESLGLAREIERCKKKKVRAGKGKMRGRKYRKKKGILFVLEKGSKAFKSAKNIAGADVVSVEDLMKKNNTELFAPGTMPGRLTVFSKSSIEKMKNIE